jgi:hypothetical protein
MSCKVHLINHSCYFNMTKHCVKLLNYILEEIIFTTIILTFCLLVTMFQTLCYPRTKSLFKNYFMVEPFSFPYAANTDFSNCYSKFTPPPPFFCDIRTTTKKQSNSNVIL